MHLGAEDVERLAVHEKMVVAPIFPEGRGISNDCAMSLGTTEAIARVKETARAIRPAERSGRRRLGDGLTADVWPCTRRFHCVGESNFINNILPPDSDSRSLTAFLRYRFLKLLIEKSFDARTSLRIISAGWHIDAPLTSSTTIHAIVHIFIQHEKTRPRAIIRKPDA